jgi:putative chitinase
MGSLGVALIRGIPNEVVDRSQSIPVRYLSPFYGVTSIRFTGNDPAKFDDVQKSYGMWMVPPDVGTIVMVIFVDGDINQGYWIGCVPEFLKNHMIPGIAASDKVALSEEQKKEYSRSILPVGEALLQGRSITEYSDPDSMPRPVHPFADRLRQQGLLNDRIRGTTNSTARRESPSNVFGISTPGPFDKRPDAPKRIIGYTVNTDKSLDKPVPISRLGGSTFVMDDGDITGENELVRLRTRTGHQILLHNSQDLVYIANAKGTAWIELTSNGKIDIYAQDSVSIHSEVDFNFRANRDVNIEAGRNIRMRAVHDMETNVSGFYHLLVDGAGKITFKGNRDDIVCGDYSLSGKQTFNIDIASDIIATSGGALSLSGSAKTMIGSTGNVNIGSNALVLISGVKVETNGTPAEPPAVASSASAPPYLQAYSLPYNSTSAGWANDKFYKADNITSIMQRVPTHEPYVQHENINPQQFAPASTDSTLASRAQAGIADNPNTQTTSPANVPDVVPGTCDPKYSKDINAPSSRTGIDALKQACADLGITAPAAVAAVLGIAGGESRWKVVEEGFNYTAARLLQVFPTVFKGDQALAQQYAGNPNNTLPEFLYGYQTGKGRGLGNTQPGDGAAFIGRGYIQLTGRGNYTRYSKLLYDTNLKLINSATGLIDNPKLLNDPKIAAYVSVLYFKDRVKVAQTDPGYFEAAVHAVGYCVPDIYATKKGYYECFLGQLSGQVVTTGAGTILTSPDGKPVTTGVK